MVTVPTALTGWTHCGFNCYSEGTQRRTSPFLYACDSGLLLSILFSNSSESQHQNKHNGQVVYLQRHPPCNGRSHSCMISLPCQTGGRWSSDRGRNLVISRNSNPISVIHYDTLHSLNVMVMVKSWCMSMSSWGCSEYSQALIACTCPRLHRAPQLMRELIRCT